MIICIIDLLSADLLMSRYKMYTGIYVMMRGFNSLTYAITHLRYVFYATVFTMLILEHCRCARIKANFYF